MGIWVVRHNLLSPSGIDSVYAFAERHGFTDLFLQVRGRGDAYFRSELEPPPPGLNADFDPLDYILNHPARERFVIHAWVNMFYVWSEKALPPSPLHVVRRHPEWLVKPVQYDTSGRDTTFASLRNTEGLFLSPQVPEARRHLLDVVSDLVRRYPVDGLHLDYIRYPGFAFDFNREGRENFRRRYIIDPLEFRGEPERFLERFGESGYHLFFERWAEHLRDTLSSFMAELAKAVHREAPDIILTAAVKPDLEKAHWQYYQDWDNWLAEGSLDVAIPMNYATDNALFLRRTERIIRACGTERVWMGVAIYNQPAASAWTKIAAARELPLAGVVLFSYDQFRADPALARSYQRFRTTQEDSP